MGYNLLINGVYWGYNPLILTFDPNFLGHPSRCAEWDGNIYLSPFPIEKMWPFFTFRYTKTHTFVTSGDVF